MIQLSYRTTSPVVLCIFNRPDVTRRVFDAIKTVQPRALYVVADAPRQDVEGEEQLCAQTRKIIEDVTWPCEVTLDYATKNLGCKQRIYSGISNAFKKFDFAIILEDDCLPSPDFFRFVDTMRKRYKDDEKVMHISGTSFVRPHTPKASYYRSPYPLIWGWATWRRAWVNFDLSMSDWPELKARLEGEVLSSTNTHRRFLKYLEKSYLNTVSTWDYPYNAYILKNRGHCISPLYNLISNIGFGDQSTHTSNSNSAQSSIPIDELPNELIPANKDEVDKYYSRVQLNNGLYRPRKIVRHFYQICNRLRIPLRAGLHRPKE